jgi:hypothetical protein
MARMIPRGAALLVTAGMAAYAASEGGASSPATDAAAATDSATVWTVERWEREEAELPTLQFLEENRDFFRARLDALLLIADRRALDGAALDPRFLRWQEMLAEIGRARDSSAVANGRIATHTLLESVAGIEELEREMDAMDRLLAEQHGRLGVLEEDFIGQQKTALVVVLSGLPHAGAPRTVVLEDPDGATYRVTLTDDARESLARGGATELAHELVEPRPHRFLVSLEGDGWTSARPAEIALAPARDRLTFLELDVSTYDPANPVLATSIWTR